VFWGSRHRNLTGRLAAALDGGCLLVETLQEGHPVCAGQGDEEALELVGGEEIPRESFDDEIDLLIGHDTFRLKTGYQYPGDEGTR